MKIIHIYSRHRQAKWAFNEYLETMPDRFHREKLYGISGEIEHHFLGLGIWSSFKKMERIKPDRAHVYFTPNDRTLVGIQAFCHLTDEHIHLYPQEVFHAG